MARNEARLAGSSSARRMLPRPGGRFAARFRGSVNSTSDRPSGRLRFEAKSGQTLTGRGSGETIQIGFSGNGWLLIQPSEGQVAGAGVGGGSSSSGGVGGALGNLLGG